MVAVDQPFLRPTKVRVERFVRTKVLAPILLRRDHLHRHATFLRHSMYLSSQRIPRPREVVNEPEFASLDVRLDGLLQLLLASTFVFCSVLTPFLLL